MSKCIDTRTGRVLYESELRPEKRGDRTVYVEYRDGVRAEPRPMTSVDYFEALADDELAERIYDRIKHESPEPNQDVPF